MHYPKEILFLIIILFLAHHEQFEHHQDAPVRIKEEKYENYEAAKYENYEENEIESNMDYYLDVNIDADNENYIPEKTNSHPWSSYKSGPPGPWSSKSNGKTYRCDLCANNNKIYSSYNSLYNHKKFVHGYGYNRKTSKISAANVKKPLKIEDKDVKLEDITTVDEDLNTFMCKPCGKYFETMQNLRRHLSDVHDLDQFETQSEKSVQCEFCDMAFVQQSRLRSHMLTGK